MRFKIWFAAILAAQVVLTSALSAQSISQRQEEFARTALPAELGKIPQVKCPLYVWEFHIWYQAPFGPDGRHGYYHGGTAEIADTESYGPDWMRHRKSVGYPLVGPYNSENTDIIRWQFQCLKNSAVDGVFIHLYPEWAKGDFFVWEPTFAKMLDIAQEVGIHIGIHDEVQFRRGTKAQDPDVMVKRLSDLLKKYARHPAFLRIDGKPVVTFAYWNYFNGKVPPEQMQKIFQRVDAECGEPMFWVPAHAASSKNALLDMPEVGGMVVMSNSNNQFRQVTTNPEFIAKSKRPVVSGYVDQPLGSPFSDDDMKNILAAQTSYPGKMLGFWGYPGFENSTQRASRDHVAWLPRRGGKTLVELLSWYSERKPGFIILTSWNDWEENTALEPGIDYDGYAGDPYLYCRILAASKGKTFTPPPLPPKEAVDPWMWQPLYGIDKRAPEVIHTRYSPLEPAIVATVSDSAHAVKSARMLTQGDAWLSVVDSATLKKKGILSVEPLAATPEGGIKLETDRTLQITVDATALSGSGDHYVAIEFYDSAQGSLVLNYPSLTPLVDYKPSDERKLKVGPAVSTTGGGKWRAEVRQMRGLKVGDEKITMALSFRAPKNSNTKDSKGRAIRISRIHFFSNMTDAREGTEMSFAAAESQQKTYRFATPDLAGTTPRAVYLITEDSEGNRSAPIAVTADQR